MKIDKEFIWDIIVFILTSSYFHHFFNLEMIFRKRFFAIGNVNKTSSLSFSISLIKFFVLKDEKCIFWLFCLKCEIRTNEGLILFVHRITMWKIEKSKEEWFLPSYFLSYWRGLLKYIQIDEIYLGPCENTLKVKLQQ